jgi:hypothetical protein
MKINLIKKNKSLNEILFSLLPFRVELKMN